MRIRTYIIGQNISTSLSEYTGVIWMGKSWEEYVSVSGIINHYYKNIIILNSFLHNKDYYYWIDFYKKQKSELHIKWYR